MNSKQQLFNQRIVKKGVQDVKGTVTAIKEWFESNDFHWVETRNITKEKDKGIEFDIAFKGEKDIEDYFRRQVEVEILLTRAKKVKVQDMVLENANIEVLVRGTLITDYQNLYSSPIREFWQKLQERYVIKKDKKDQVGRTYTETQDLVETIKAALGMPSS